MSSETQQSRHTFLLKRRVRGENVYCEGVIAGVSLNLMDQTSLGEGVPSVDELNRFIYVLNRDDWQDRPEYFSFGNTVGQHSSLQIGMKHSLSHQRVVALDTSNNCGLDELCLWICRASVHNRPPGAIE